MNQNFNSQFSINILVFAVARLCRVAIMLRALSRSEKTLQVNAEHQPLTIKKAIPTFAALA